MKPARTSSRDALRAVSAPQVPAAQASAIAYQSGFGNEHASEAIAGALPVGQNSPQRAPLGLYTEQLSGTAFTAPRATNRRSWLYRIRPAAVHKPFRPLDQGLLRGSPFEEVPTPPNQLRWDPWPLPTQPTDFVAGLTTLAGNGDAAAHVGCAIHVYGANRSMSERFFYDGDGELLFVPQLGGLRLATELGVLELAPGEAGLVPRGVRFRVELLDGQARGFLCENYGAAFRLPELGPIGANGLANPRDFQAPVASYEDREGRFELVAKFMGRLWSAELAHSPLDVVAWHGNYAPWKYDLARFCPVNVVGFDHADPSIFTVLTSPSDSPGTANVDFVLFPPRWLVAEHTFRPPYFHRNVMSEFMALIHGEYDGKASFQPGAASLHNSMTGHGPDVPTYEKASGSALQPRRLENTLAFMFESRMVLRPTRVALECPQLQRDYFEIWQGLPKRFDPSGAG